MADTITFLGAAGTVTGSKYLVESGGKKILVDVGLFQGEREWRDRNWADPPCALQEIDAVLLTHAHIDHTGMLPRYRRLGLSCPVYCTRPTLELSKVLLLDSAHLQEEETAWRSVHKKSRHSTPLPLYTRQDSESALSLLKSVEIGKQVRLFDGVYATWQRMGHIIGAASILLECRGKRIQFSGDVGRYHVPILKDPTPPVFGELLLIEATYGDRLHDKEDPRTALARVVNESCQRKGILIIPSFAVGRVQLLLYYLRELKEQRLIPDIPVIIDSPMACDATEIYSRCTDDYDEDALGIVRQGRHPFSFPKLGYTRSAEESKRLNGVDEPMIVIAGSGTLQGGRILHHLRHRISSPLNTILFVGFQAPGGRGAWIKSGAQSLRLFGEEVPIRAHIAEISGLSAHADRDELLTWCRAAEGRPGKVAVVHAEPESASAFGKTLRSKFGWDVSVASYLERMSF